MTHQSLTSRWTTIYKHTLPHLAPLERSFPTHLACPPRPLLCPHHPRRDYRQLNLPSPRRITLSLVREAEIARGEEHEHTATGIVY